MSPDIEEVVVHQLEIGSLFMVDGGILILVSQDPSKALDIHNGDTDGNIPTVRVNPNATAYLYKDHHRSRHQEMYPEIWVRARNQRSDLADLLQ